MTKEITRNDLIIGKKTIRYYRFSYSELISTGWRDIEDELAEERNNE